MVPNVLFYQLFVVALVVISKGQNIHASASASFFSSFTSHERREDSRHIFKLWNMVWSGSPARSSRLIARAIWALSQILLRRS